MATTTRTTAARTVATAAAATKPARATITARTAAAAPAAAADKAKARTAPKAAPRYVVAIGGTTYTAPFALSDFASPLFFAQSVVAALAWAHTGVLAKGVDHVGGAKALYHGALRMADGTVLAFSFGAPELISATPTPAAKPVKAQPAPAAIAARKVASAAARTTSLTVGATLSGGMPVAKAAAIAKAADAAHQGTRYTITAKGLGHFTADKASGQSWAGFVATAISPRVCELATWAKASIETITQGDDGGFRARLANGKGDSIVIEGKADAAAAAPIAAGTPLPAFVTRGGATVSAAPVSSLAKALAARDALNAAPVAVGRATPAGAKTEAARARDIAARGKLALAAEQPRRTAKVAEMYEAAARGVMPTAPDFSAPTHARYVKPLAEVVAKAKAGDVVWLKNHPMQPLSSSRVMLCRYRDLAIVAIEARKAKAAAKAK